MMAVSDCVPVLAIIVAPAGKTQLIGVVVTFDVATNFTGSPGQALAVAGTTDKLGLGATIIVAETGELQYTPEPPVPVIV